ncbi:rho guanine nucleotide exchange factor 28 isoform X1 [Ahaetulla prasina]|uniref:rho guanine nucleotide exchange factor 28 isoform X1 n=3 Tax=Ahaetulla prasina TaxID=499056 RepID=UPI002647C0A2|nr:rho guanine nucleotide exchange factor 28 isoform X1 [Ahaetulla prasina]
MTDAAMMELSCTEAPLYGQTIIYGKFDNILPEEAEFYFVYKGSIQKHVVFAKQVTENTLESIIPAHREQEDVSVFVVMYGKENEFVILGSSFLTFKHDIACELACFLVSQVNCLTPSSHHTLLSQFDLIERDLQSMDHDIMLAMACEEIPSSWNIVGNSTEDESKCKETLLHLAMRLGLVQLSQFLLFQPGGTVAVTLLNEEGLTPLDLALQNGHFSLVEIFSKRQTIHPFEISKVEIDENAVLQFAYSSGTSLLTFNHITDHSLESDVQLFRKYLWDKTFTQKNLTAKQAETLGGMQMPCNSITSKEDLIEVASEEPPLKNEDLTFHQEHIIHPQENEDENVLDLAEQYSPFEAYRRRPNPSTFFAAAKLSAMLNGNDEVYANRMVVDQLEDAGVKYIDNSQSTSETNTDLSKDPEVLENIPSNKNLSSRMIPSLDTSGSYMPLKKIHGLRNHRYPFIKKRSSSLDDLDVDNGDERSHNCYSSVSYNSSVILPSDRERLSASEPTTRLDGSMNRAESLPLSSSLQSKESLLSGIRSRSYSYTSPKVLLGKPQCAQEFIQCDSNDESHAFNLHEQSEKRIQEEEWDKYIIPTKSESEKYKVSRTFSFLMNRMASTRNKSKAKNKDAKEKEKANRHHFVSGSYAGVMPCFTCEKPLLGKESLQCSYCNAIVHRSCKDCAPACTKKLQDRSYVKNKIQTVQTNLSFRDTPQPAFLATLPSTTIPIGVSLMKKEALQQQHSLSRSVPSTTSERKSMSSLEPDSNTSSWRSRSHSEELLQTLGSASSVDSFIIEDDVDASLWNDLSTDTLEFEAESWSLVVEPWFCNQQEKDVIKRQDVIFELMQTEVHHIHTLFIMSKIFRKGMKEELQLDHSTVDKIFPCLDELLELHQQFFCRMKERRQLSSQEGSDRNFVICKIGDVLVQQFSEENARKMKTIYGEFCSHQKEAVSLFKELQQNKKFQNFIKLRNSNLLARRRGIPECILLVTQRITKYPVLVERILQYTREGTEEHQDLCKALNLIKDMIAAVDLQVSEYEKKQKLLEILSKVENKTYTKLKNGHVFRKQDLIKKQRTLLYEGLVYWKTATGRFKDILALLLNDVMLFLQEKDQKYIFAAVDQKPAVIALQKLIVREVANEERGMFLISASSTGPEMYEIHTSSKEERSHWMRQIQEAVESCPEEEGKIGDSDEDRKITEARAAKIQKCQVLLNNQDQQICNYLEEKLNIYAKLGNMSGFEEVHAEPHLLIKPDSGETPQVASLLAAALKEAENLHTTVALLQTKDSKEENVGDSCLTYLSETEACEPFTDCTELQKVEKESCNSDLHDESNVAEMDILDQEENACFSASAQTEVVQTIQNLTRLLYSIQAALTIQDTHIEINKLLLQEHERSSLSHSPRSTFFPEQEKHRNLKEEFANIHKLQQQFQQEQQRWHRECEQQQQAHETRESRLLEKEKECCSQEELLYKNREELDGQFQDYQQNLERLQESQRMVEKERETVRLQQNILHHWKHNHQSNLPAVISSGNNEIMGPLHLDSFCGENSAIIKETLVQMSLNHLNRSNSLAYQDCGNSVNLTDSELPRKTENQANFNMDISCQQTFTADLSTLTGPHHHPSSNTNQSDACNNHMNALQSQYPRLHDFDSTHGNFHPSDVLLHNLPRDMEQESENSGLEEKIVYL